MRRKKKSKEERKDQQLGKATRTRMMPPMHELDAQLR